MTVHRNPQAANTESGPSTRSPDWSATPLGPRATWPAALTAIHAMMMASPFAMCAGWGPQLTLIYNDAYAEFLADRHPAALGCPIAEVWHDVWADIHPLVERAMAGEPVRHTDMHLVMTRKGHAEDTYWTFAYSALRDGGAVVGFLNVATETTAGVLAGQRRDAAEANLRELNATLEARVATLSQERDQLWRLSRSPFVVCDTDGVWLSASPAWTDILGWTEAELLGRTSGWMEHPDDHDGSRAKVAEVAAGEILLDFTNRFRDRGGEYRRFSWTAVSENGRLFCVARDVTEEQRQNEILVEQASQLKLFGDIIQTSAAPICAFDPEFRLIAFNQAHSDEFFRIFGYRVRLGEVFPDLFPPDQGAVMRGFMARALTGESYTVTEAFGDPSLVKPYWEVSYTPLRDPDGRIIAAFHFARDVTARLRAEEELNIAQESLRQSQKLEAVGQLTGGVAHDFNNLLTVIKSSTDLLKRPNLAEDRRARYVGAISDTVDRAAKLTGQLLAFARRQALKPEVFSVCDSVRALTDMVGTLTGSRIEIVTDLQGATCHVDADPSQFDTAIVNMAVNARDAMNGEGRLEIRVRSVEAIPAIRSHAVVHGAFVAVSISDTGTGIPEDRLERIFEPFFTTKVVGQGTGLGLSQVFGFAKQSGGEVTVESELGRGTTFTLYLPRVAGAEATRDASEPEPLFDGHGTCVLVVEDNVEVGTFAVQTLTDLGYVVVLATDAQEALAELGRDADRFDVVFSDVVMPGMNGIDLAHRIRDEHDDLPVLLASGYSHVLAQNGTYGFELLHKPYSVEQLSRLLRKVATWQRRKRVMGKERS